MRQNAIFWHFTIIYIFANFEPNIFKTLEWILEWIVNLNKNNVFYKSSIAVYYSNINIYALMWFLIGLKWANMCLKTGNHINFVFNMLSETMFCKTSFHYNIFFNIYAQKRDLLTFLSFWHFRQLWTQIFSKLSNEFKNETLDLNRNNVLYETIYLYVDIYGFMRFWRGTKMDNQFFYVVGELYFVKHPRFSLQYNILFLYMCPNVWYFAYW